MGKIKKGTYFYLIDRDGPRLRKIIWVKGGVFEFHMGWSKIKRLVSNPNKKSKVKHILNYK